MALYKSLILYVDDNTDSCELLKFLLEQENEGRYIVTTSSEIRQALNLIETVVFDLYILDQKMPGMSGVELCSLIRKTHAHIPIMFYSGMALMADRQAAMNAGANEYLVKPNDLATLTDTVSKLLSESSLKRVGNSPTQN